MKVGERDTYLFEELGETEARYPRVLEARLCKKIAWKFAAAMTRCSNTDLKNE